MYLIHFNPYHDKLGRFDKAPTLFISGSSKTQTEGGQYYRKELPKEVRKEIDSAMKSGKTIIVGDAPGIDRQVQDYLNSKEYKNVEIYGPGHQVRYSANSKWKTNPIDSGKYKPDTDEWRAEKDIVMSMTADEALAIVLENGGAGATRDNIRRMIDQNKDVKVYELDSNGGIKKVKSEYKNPQELKSSMAKFKYKEYDKLMSLEQVKKTKSGSCHDQVIYEMSELRNQGLNPKAKFIMAVNKNGQGGETHSFVYYNKDGKTNWFENAWGDNNGIHQFTNEQSMTNKVISDFSRRNPNSKIYMADLNIGNHKTGETLEEFVDKCMDDAELVKN